MILQSHNGYIEFLPALPDAWPKGEFSGLKARGAFEIDLKWENGEWIKAEIMSEKGIPCIIKSEKKIKVSCEGQQIKLRSAGKGKFSLNTEAGNTYLVTH